jgi:hypothetical protein
MKKLLILTILSVAAVSLGLCKVYAQRAAFPENPATTITEPDVTEVTDITEATTADEVSPATVSESESEDESDILGAAEGVENPGPKDLTIHMTNEAPGEPVDINDDTGASVLLDGDVD